MILNSEYQSKNEKCVQNVEFKKTTKVGNVVVNSINCNIRETGKG